MLSREILRKHILHRKSGVQKIRKNVDNEELE